MTKIYLVKYSKGEYPEEYSEYSIRAFTEKDSAEKYILKFNTLLGKLQEHYKKREILENNSWFLDVNKMDESDFYRSLNLRGIGISWIEEIELI